MTKSAPITKILQFYSVAFLWKFATFQLLQAKSCNPISVQTSHGVQNLEEQRLYIHKGFYNKMLKKIHKST